jgi:deoxycytidine triphosphate deaminase
MVHRSGNFVQDRVPESEDLQSQALSIEAVHKQRGNAVVGDEGLLRRERSTVDAYSRREYEQRAQSDAVDILGRLGMDRSSTERFYRIGDEDSYFIEFAESVIVPEGHVGVVRPRDTLRRSGLLLETAFVEPGQEDVETHVFVEDRFVLLAEDATVAEMVVVKTAG